MRSCTRAAELRERPAVVVATERMDDDPGWRALDRGGLIHVTSDLAVSSRPILDRPLRHPLSLADLGTQAAASQKP